MSYNNDISDCYVTYCLDSLVCINNADEIKKTIEYIL